MRLDLHYLPGLFGAGGTRLLGRVLAGVGSWRVRSLRADAALASSPEEITAWLAGTSCEDRSSASLVIGAEGGSSWDAEIEVAGTPVSGRVMIGISLILPAGRPLGAMRELELGLLGIACAALAGEDQGAVMIGADLGSVAEAGGPGTVSEQLRAVVDRQGDQLQIVVCTADTAASLGSLEGFASSALGDLCEFRREAPPP